MKPDKNRFFSPTKRPSLAAVRRKNLPRNTWSRFDFVLSKEAEREVKPAWPVLRSKGPFGASLFLLFLFFLKEKTAGIFLKNFGISPEPQHSQKMNFRFQHYTTVALNLLAHSLHQLKHVSGCGPSSVHQKIRMHRGNHRSTNPQPLQSTGLY